MRLYLGQYFVCKNLKVNTNQYFTCDYIPFIPFTKYTLKDKNLIMQLNMLVIKYIFFSYFIFSWLIFLFFNHQRKTIRWYSTNNIFSRIVICDFFVGWTPKLQCCGTSRSAITNKK